MASEARAGAAGRTADERAALWLGALGVLGFSFTFPMTRIAVPVLGAEFVGIGRAVIAALLAGIALAVARAPLPARSSVGRLALVVVGVIIGFPLASAIALRSVPSAHGAVVVGLLPIATALVAVTFGRERVGGAFWIGALAGTATVVAFILGEGFGRPSPADAWLALAVVCAAFGYWAGGSLASEYPGWQVISWGLVFSTPFDVAILAASHALVPPPASPAAWGAFAWVAIVSMLLAFFAFYRALALGGVARISQLQLAQPLLTVVWSGLLVGERIGVTTYAAALAVVGAIALTQAGRRRGTAA